MPPLGSSPSAPITASVNASTSVGGSCCRRAMSAGGRQNPKTEHNSESSNSTCVGDILKFIVRGGQTNAGWEEAHATQLEGSWHATQLDSFACDPRGSLEAAPLRPRES